MQPPGGFKSSAAGGPSGLADVQIAVRWSGSSRVRKAGILAKALPSHPEGTASFATPMHSLPLDHDYPPTLAPPTLSSTNHPLAGYPPTLSSTNHPLALPTRRDPVPRTPLHHLHIPPHRRLQQPSPRESVQFVAWLAHLSRPSQTSPGMITVEHAVRRHGIRTA